MEEELTSDDGDLGINPVVLKQAAGAIAQEILRFPELKAANTRLLDAGIPLVFVSIEKNRKGHVEEMARTLLQSPAFSPVKVLIFLEHTMDISDLADAVWRFSNNVDPKRDHLNVKATHPGEVNHVAYDGTRKVKEFDGFDRDWPNILASEETTIARIDEIWHTLGLGLHIVSPSAKYAKQLYEGGAVAKP